MTTPPTPPRPRKQTFRLILGAIMFALGLFVAVRPLFTHDATLTGQRWLDWTFAIVFMLRGAINFRSVGRR